MSAQVTLTRPKSPEWTFRMTRTRIVLLALAGVAAGIALYRFIYGLGAATNLSDRWPWGIWIWWDVLTGVALAGGGYSTALLVHFFGRDRWKAVERGAFVTSLIGYVMVCGGLFLDLGRWYNAWRPVAFWGYHSVMFELFWCVGGYTVVQLVEFGHIFIEKVHAPRLARAMHRIYAPVLIVGVILPVLHQSALGSLYVIAKGKLDPLWWSLLLPLFFLLSSFFVGPAMVTVENFLSARSHREHRPPSPLLREMMRLAAWLMVAYLVLKVADLAWRGVIPHLLDGSVVSDLFLAEIALGVAAPTIMIFMPRVRSSARGLVTAAALVALGVALNRANVVFTGMAASAGGVAYFPYWMEFAVTIGLISVGLLAYLFITENFPILPGRETTSPAEPAPAEPARKEHALVK